jgi:penicillin-insensitive murein DD-endopeptidase
MTQGFVLASFLLATTAFGQAEPSRNHQALFALWAKVSRPFTGEQSPVGNYSAGCLMGGQALPLDGAGYSVMRPSRMRYYGHGELVSYIQHLGKKLKGEGLPLLLVGDMGRPGGGPMRSGHASHQNGLDVDLWYELSPKKPSAKERESRGARAFALREKNELSSAWGEPQRKLLTLAAEAAMVERIFVHPTIKRELCAKAPSAPWLHKVRPWWNHHDHFHVRLRCPPGAALCASQEPIDSSVNGCGEELAWWFSEEAREEGRKKAAQFSEREFPVLPEACGQMVQSQIQHRETGKL